MAEYDPALTNLGRDVFGEAHTQFNRGDFTDEDLVRRLLSTLAEARLVEQTPDVNGKSRLNLLELVAPFISKMDVQSDIESPEQEELVTTIQHELADKFSTPDRLLLPENFGTVKSKGRLYVVLADPTSLFRGSWQEIMANDTENVDSYSIEVSGQVVDTRKVMTRGLHRAMNLQAAAKYLADWPDSQVTQRERNDHGSATWYTGTVPVIRNHLTGEVTRLDTKKAGFGRDTDIYPEIRMWWQTASSTSIGIRPGVEVPDLTACA